MVACQPRAADLDAVVSVRGAGAQRELSAEIAALCAQIACGVDRLAAGSGDVNRHCRQVLGRTADCDLVPGPENPALCRSSQRDTATCFYDLERGRMLTCQPRAANLDAVVTGRGAGVQREFGAETAALYVQITRGVDRLAAGSGDVNRHCRQVLGRTADCDLVPGPVSLARRRSGQRDTAACFYDLECSRMLACQPRAANLDAVVSIRGTGAQRELSAETAGLCVQISCGVNGLAIGSGNVNRHYYQVMGHTADCDLVPGPVSLARCRSGQHDTTADRRRRNRRWQPHYFDPVHPPDKLAIYEFTGIRLPEEQSKGSLTVHQIKARPVGGF